MDEAKYAEAVKCRQEIAGLQEDIAALNHYRESKSLEVIATDDPRAVVARRFGLFIEVLERRVELIEDEFRML